MNVADQTTTPKPSATTTPGSLLETFIYDNKSVALFIWATLIWGIVGLLAGVFIALQLSGLGTQWGPSFLNQEWLSFGRLRPLHTNAVIFAFTGNAIFAGVYYSCQRLLKTPIFNKWLTRFHFWGWQTIIVLAALTLPLGITSGKEYAELEWPIDILITLVWVAFTVNIIGMIYKRRERHLYVAIWFYLATLLGIAMLHIVNSLAIPATLTKSYSVYAGQQDALVQWWYGHNAVAFFLTTPILGLMYYFLPKAAERPVFSYRLSIIHFWSLVFIYIWAGPHHLLHTALPEWAQTLGVTFSIMLWAPSWGGMINGLLTLRGAFDKVRSDPVLKFFVVAITFYGMSTFEGPLLSVREVNALSHNTDWTIGHVHSGALGWVGFMCFGLAYWLVPKIYKTELASKAMADAHFWMATLGIVLYVVTMWIAGIMQGLMWFEFTEQGTLEHNDWMDFIRASMPYYAFRTIGGALYLIGAVICLINLILTARRGTLENETVQAPPLGPDINADQAITEAVKTPGWAAKTNALHSLVERWPFLMISLTAISLAIGGLCEIVPNMVQGAMTPKIATVKPYTPLQLIGRDIYIREGCNNCHTQMVRTLRADVARFADKYGMTIPGYTRPGEGTYERPFLWGSKRTGPDLAREGLAQPGTGGALWHFDHMWDPTFIAEDSIMPRYPYLYTAELSDQYKTLSARMHALSNPIVGQTYSDELFNPIELAEAEAKALADSIKKTVSKKPWVTEKLGSDYADKLHEREIIALIAYLQRLGTDITKKP